MKLLLSMALWISSLAAFAVYSRASAPQAATNASDSIKPPQLQATNAAVSPATTNAEATAQKAPVQAPASNDPLSATVKPAPPSEDTNPPPPQAAKPSAQDLEFAHQVQMGTQQRIDGNYDLAAKMLVNVLQTNAPPELQRRALLELAQVAQDHGEWVKAQQVYSQYLHRYPEDETVPAVLLRQGLLDRKMGINAMGYTKFYAVMSSALKLRLGDINYYKGLVLQAQIEIAETYYQDGKYEDFADFFGRILKSDAPVSDPNKSN